MDNQTKKELFEIKKREPGNSNNKAIKCWKIKLRNSYKKNNTHTKTIEWIKVGKKDFWRINPGRKITELMSSIKREQIV